MGYVIEKYVQIAKGIGIKSSNFDLTEKAERFQAIYDLEWKTRISSVSLKCLHDKRFNKVQMLPLTDDLLKVREFLLDQIPKATAELINLPTVENWQYLAEIIGIQLTLFNRRRISEVFGML